MGIRVVLALVCALLPAPDRQAPSPSTLALRDLGGRTVSLASFKGKVVLVNFWATWCPPCRAEIPDLVALQERYGDEGLQVIGVTCPPYTRGRVSSFVRRAKVNYPVLLGTKGLSESAAGTDILPVTLVLDRGGRVRAKIQGILTPEEVDEKVLPLLDSDGRTSRPWTSSTRRTKRLGDCEPNVPVDVIDRLALGPDDGDGVATRETGGRINVELSGVRSRRHTRIRPSTICPHRPSQAYLAGTR